MNEFAVTVILISTFMHAGWNLLARGQRREAAFILRMLVFIAAVGLAPIIVSEVILRPFPRKAWACLAGSGMLCGAYYLFLARAYASSDFSLVYPVARALPVLLVGMGDVLRGRYPTTAGWMGMALVVVGCCLCPLRSFREFSTRHYWNRTSLWVLLTALGTVGYTVLDKVASEVVTRGPGTAARYGYFFFLISLGVYVAGLRAFPVKEQDPAPLGWRRPALAGVLCYAGYWLVLWVYQVTAHAGYVVAFRQFSIVIGVLLAFVLFKEAGRTVRLTGTALIVAGLVLIALWGR